MAQTIDNSSRWMRRGQGGRGPSFSLGEAASRPRSIRSWAVVDPGSSSSRGDSVSQHTAHLARIPVAQSDCINVRSEAAGLATMPA